MPSDGFPRPVSEVMATLADIFRYQGRVEVLELLESAHPHFNKVGYDNWDGGTTTWALVLEVPTPLYATLEPRLAAIEKEISAKLIYLDRLYPSDPVGEVTITPITPGASALGQRMAPSEIEVRRLWPEGRFRLFLSHVSEHKAAVSKLKNRLAYYGIAAFVAHEDIEPSRQWQDEIQRALRSMHALAAIVTPDFHASKWTDQEIGWALGRGILVVPIRLGEDPYGFVGRDHAITGKLDQSENLAVPILKFLLNVPRTRGEMRRTLVTAFSNAGSFRIALTLRDFIITVTDFTEDEKTALRNACKENDQVSGATGVATAIYKTFGEPPKLEPIAIQEEDDIPF